MVRLTRCQYATSISANIYRGNDLPLVLIAGPCALESRAHALEVSAALVEITGKLGIPLIYKTSFDKANRTSLTGVAASGWRKGYRSSPKSRGTRLPGMTDVHLPRAMHAGRRSGPMCWQIPAYLCRQTDLLVAAAKTSAAINIKRPVPGTVGHAACRAKVAGSGKPAGAVM